MSLAITVIGLLLAGAAGWTALVGSRGRFQDAATPACFAAFTLEVMATFHQSATRVPGWMLVATAVGLAVTFGILPIPLHFRGPDGDDDDDGGGPGPGRGDGPRGPVDEPSWWPQFERDFWSHLDRQRGPREPVAA